jgi:3-phenylpropionate/trans-cinnamate dioxygenase ferredoxin subunit
VAWGGGLKTKFLIRFMKEVPEGYIRVGKTSDIPDGQLRVFDVNGESIIVVNINGEFFAFRNECSHMELDLTDSEIDGEVLTCPWHGAQFNIRTGDVVRLPASEPLERYDIMVDGDDIFVKIS